MSTVVTRLSPRSVSPREGLRRGTRSPAPDRVGTFNLQQLIANKERLPSPRGRSTSPKAEHRPPPPPRTSTNGSSRDDGSSNVGRPNSAAARHGVARVARPGSAGGVNRVLNMLAAPATMTTAENEKKKNPSSPPPSPPRNQSPSDAFSRRPPGATSPAVLTRRPLSGYKGRADLTDSLAMSGSGSGSGSFSHQYCGSNRPGSAAVAPGTKLPQLANSPVASGCFPAPAEGGPAAAAAGDAADSGVSGRGTATGSPPRPVRTPISVRTLQQSLATQSCRNPTSYAGSREESPLSVQSGASSPTSHLRGGPHRPSTGTAPASSILAGEAASGNDRSTPKPPVIPFWAKNLHGIPPKALQKKDGESSSSVAGARSVPVRRPISAKLRPGAVVGVTPAVEMQESQMEVESRTDDEGSSSPPGTLNRTQIQQVRTEDAADGDVEEL